ncbi:MAG: hypothetical protein IJ699_08055 [Bacteroidaceae bacterium]|nr:hypothetical protein [Bacteroidaceae bacterium]
MKEGERGPREYARHPTGKDEGKLPSFEGNGGEGKREGRREEREGGGAGGAKEKRGEGKKMGRGSEGRKKKRPILEGKGRWFVKLKYDFLS